MGIIEVSQYKVVLHQYIACSLAGILDNPFLFDGPLPTKILIWIVIKHTRLVHWRLDLKGQLGNNRNLMKRLK